MPKAMERRLMQVAERYARSGKLRRRKGESEKEAKSRLVYGTMRKTGWKPRRERG